MGRSLPISGLTGRLSAPIAVERVDCDGRGVGVGTGLLWGRGTAILVGKMRELMCETQNKEG